MQSCKCLNVRERVEVVEWNKKWSSPFPCCLMSRQCPWKKTLTEKKIILIESVNGGMVVIKWKNLCVHIFWMAPMSKMSFLSRATNTRIKIAITVEVSKRWWLNFQIQIISLSFYISHYKYFLYHLFKIFNETMQCVILDSLLESAVYFSLNPL